MNTQRRLNSLLLFGLPMGLCLPVAAQHSSIPASPSSIATPILLAKASVNPVPVRTLRQPSATTSAAPGTPPGTVSPGGPVSPAISRVAPLPKISILAARSAADSFARNSTHDQAALRVSSVGSSVDFAQTPFSQQVRLPLATLLGGRVKMAGFDRIAPTENLLWGLPGAGSLPAWGIGTQSHPGVFAPRADESYGVSLALRFSRDPEATRSTPLLRCLGRVFGVRGCRLN